MKWEHTGSNRGPSACKAEGDVKEPKLKANHKEIYVMTSKNDN
jgi:hypothetical protein